MSSSLHISDKETIKTMEWKGRIGSKKGEDSSIYKEIHGVSFFWDSRGIVVIDYPQKGKTINSEYNANLLQRLSDEIK